MAIINLTEIFQIPYKYFSSYLSVAFFNFHDFTFKVTNIVFFHRSDLITKQNEILQKC